MSTTLYSRIPSPIAAPSRKTVLSSSNDLSGLMKFAERDEWAACFDEVFGDHVEPVLDAADLTLEDLATLLGADWGTTVWGCAFEDFLTQDF